MPEKFRGKYRTISMRKPDWDYGSNGAYFITICTKDRKKYLGKVKDGKMKKSEVGSLVHNFWTKIPTHFTFVELGEFIVMPDHFHGIIIIDNVEEAPKLGASPNENGNQEQPPPSLGMVVERKIGNPVP